MSLSFLSTINNSLAHFAVRMLLGSSTRDQGRGRAVTMIMFLERWTLDFGVIVGLSQGSVL